MIGYIIAMLFFVSFIGSIVSLSVFIVDLIANKQLSKKDCYSFLVGNNIKYFSYSDLSNRRRLWSVKEMTQYIITTFTDSSGMQHKHVAKLKDNQTATVINAESKEKAMKIYEEDKMIKRILKIWFTIAMYEIGKYITNQIIIKLQNEDDVEVPSDYARESDQTDLNGVRR